MANIVKPDGVAVIDTVNSGGYLMAHEFEKSGAETVEFHAAIVHIGDYAFYMCNTLKKIKIPEGVVSIGSSAFEGCSALEEVELPSTLETISSCAFAKCKALKRIVIPTGVTYIGTSAFECCSSLKDVQFEEAPDKDDPLVDNIEHPLYVTSDAFIYCDSLETIQFPDRTVEFAACACVGKNLESLVLPANARIDHTEYVSTAPDTVKVFFRMWELIALKDGTPDKSTVFHNRRMARLAMHMVYQDTLAWAAEEGMDSSELDEHGISRNDAFLNLAYEGVEFKWFVRPVLVPKV